MRSLSINGVRKTRHAHAKEGNWIFILRCTQKQTQNGLKT